MKAINHQVGRVVVDDHDADAEGLPLTFALRLGSGP
jgi:hypothetical protein